MVKIGRIMIQEKDTTGWGVVGVILAMMSSPDLMMQAIVAILFPTVGWTLLYFVKRELIHRFPPKDKKTGKNLDKPNNYLE